MLVCASVREAAAQAGISSTRTAYRRLKEPAFQERLRERRRELSAHASGRIIGLLAKAVDVLRDALEGKEVSKDGFLSAKVVLETARAIEADDIEERVEKLEQIARRPQDSYKNDERPIPEILESIRRLNTMLGGVLDEESAAGNGDGNGDGEEPTAEDLRRVRREIEEMDLDRGGGDT